MITLLGICCNQWEPILQQTKEERERIKKIRCRKEANAARDELNLPWKEACCPSCKKTGYLRVYDIYEHPVGAGLVPHDGPLSFLRLKCHKCETTHAVFPEDYIPFSSDSRFYYCMGVYTMKNSSMGLGSDQKGHGYTLFSDCPELAAQWHPTKNGDG